jgi:hypothetical protein
VVGYPCYPFVNETKKSAMALYKKRLKTTVSTRRLRAAVVGRKSSTWWRRPSRPRRYPGLCAAFEETVAQ